MQKKYLALVSISAAILLIGAGCSQTTDSNDGNIGIKDADTVPADNTTPTPGLSTPTPNEVQDNNTNPAPVTSNISGELVLTAQAQTDRSVKLSWSAPEGLDQTNKFIIVSGPDAYPTHDGKHKWFRQFYTNREMIWRDLLPGTIHFRICLTENSNNDICTKYSNDTEVYLE
ncbi:MAG: hypothetical protein KBD73_03380 [Candidatus Magasanikbacteria bacterium]|nr:hypothetical protein [Candidatus Magasanikbacteria bacterium]